MTRPLPYLYLLNCMGLSLWTAKVYCLQNSLHSLYSKARQVRTIEGHEQALPLYEELLCRNPSDVTAATRIAAERDSPQRHKELGRGGSLSQRRRFAQFLESS
eukprot:CAMPEP_0178746990 /NCGR_PEP_ID=MMETSP0744-20121128/8087_1 /TAXON_ID=913974 /ORGANISM="Nitzschia punctata, Strain CCMP561" /LENGTH=102 /DNA_ID=CAMNT_0020400205 /DNA_START=236 /DNA_END=540 /DNA_ORIENTATION=+